MPKWAKPEDDGLRIAVDGDDGGRILHADGMLQRAGDAAGDVEPRVHGGAGLTDLLRPLGQPGLDRATRGGDTPADCLGQVFDVVPSGVRRSRRPRR